MSGRILITGAGGQLGSHLAAQATREGRDMLAKTSSQWDITDPAAAAEFVKKGDVVVNGAAYHNGGGGEGGGALPHADNAPGPGRTPRACRRVGARLIHVRTDCVLT